MHNRNEIFRVIQDIQQCLILDDAFKVCHVSRNLNQAVHVMAKLAFRMHRFRGWNLEDFSSDQL